MHVNLIDITETTALFTIIIQSVPYFKEIIMSAILITIGYLLNRFVIQRSINEFCEKAELDQHHMVPLKRIASAIIFLIIFFIILGILGLGEILWGVMAVAGFAGIVVGMATRDIISDTLTGILIYIYRPFKIGDSVMIDDISGIVKDIRVDGVRVKAWSGELVIIPNSKIRTSIIRNFSIDSRRATINFYVDYSSDFNKTLGICKEVLDKIPEVMKNPNPVINVEDFNEQSVKILILVWFSIDDFSRGFAKVKKGLADEFSRMGLKIPIIRSKSMSNNV